MSGPRVSVIVPVYNGAAFLAEALRGVYAQTYPVAEVIVVDDGSTDASAVVARDHAARVITQANQGPGAARNAGITAATGDVLAFLDADDCWLPGKIAAQLDALAADPALGFVTCRMRIRCEEGCALPAAYNARHYAADPPAMVPSALCARREALMRVGGFNPAMRFGEDTDWFARAADAGVRHAVVDAVLLEKRIHAANLTRDTAGARGALFAVLRQSIARKRQREEP